MTRQTTESSIEDYWKVSNDLDNLKFKMILMHTDRTRKEAMNLIKDIQQNFDLICTNAERRLLESETAVKDL